MTYNISKCFFLEEFQDVINRIVDIETGSLKKDECCRDAKNWVILEGGIWKNIRDRNDIKKRFDNIGFCGIKKKSIGFINLRMPYYSTFKEYKENWLYKKVEYYLDLLDFYEGDMKVVNEVIEDEFVFGKIPDDLVKSVQKQIRYFKIYDEIDSESDSESDSDSD